MRKIILIALLLALPLVCFGQDEKQPLQLTIKSDKEVYEGEEEIVFSITIRNIGERDVILNLGERLGNGIQIPSKLQFELIDKNGKKINYHYHGRVPGVAGSLDTLAVPVKINGEYTLNIPLSDIVLNSIPSSSYKITCFYQGAQSDLRNPTFIKFWEGEVTSNTVKFVIH